MALINKIEKLGLTDRVLALTSQGKTTYEIAAILTQEATGAYSISQPTVARWLKGVRQERAEQTRSIVHEYIKATVPADLDSINEVQVWLIERFRSIEEVTRESVSAALGKRISQKMFDRLVSIFPTTPYDLRTRAEIGMKIIRIVDVKLKYAGILEDDAGSKSDSVDPVNLDDFRIDPSKEEAMNG